MAVEVTFAQRGAETSLLVRGLQTDYVRTDNASWRFFRQRIMELSSLGSDNASWRLVAETAELRSALFPL